MPGLPDCQRRQRTLIAWNLGGKVDLRDPPKQLCSGQGVQLDADSNDTVEAVGAGSGYF